MSESVVLKFVTNGLKEAARIGKQLAKTAAGAREDAERAGEAAAEAGGGDGGDLRVERQGQASAGDRRAPRRRRRRGFGAGGIAAAGVNFGEVDETLIQFAQGGGALSGASLGVKGLTQTLGFAAGGVVGGLVVSLGTTVVEEFVRPFLRARFEALEREQLDPILARLDEVERTSFARRLKDDDAFAERVARDEINRNAKITDQKIWVRSPGPLGRLD